MVRVPRGEAAINAGYFREGDDLLMTKSAFAASEVWGAGDRRSRKCESLKSVERPHVKTDDGREMRVVGWRMLAPYLEKA